MNVLTIVSADVEQSQPEDLIAAYETLLAQGLPEGLLQTRLLGAGQGHWATAASGTGEDSVESERS